MTLALTIFGTPNGTDAIISPSNFELPDALYRVVDAKFHFYGNGEVFRIKKIAVGSSVLRYYSIHTRANDQRSSRDGAFIGAGVFTHSDNILDAVVLVACLRKMLRNAMEATVVNGHFVKTITESASLIRIPEEFDRLISSQARPTAVLGSSAADSLCFIPLKSGVMETPEVLIALNEAVPGVLPNSLYFSTDPRCEADCLKDSDFQVVSVTELLSMPAKYQESKFLEASAMVEKAERMAMEIRSESAPRMQQLQIEMQAVRDALTSSEQKYVQSQQYIAKLNAQNSRIQSQLASRPFAEETQQPASLPFWILGLAVLGGSCLIVVVLAGLYQLVMWIFSAVPLH